MDPTTSNIINGINNHAMSKNMRVTTLKIDNLPPGKNWKQIKYLIGGIIHHSNVLKIKVLPPLTSIIPPFVTFQNCVVTLKISISEEELNRLICTLNTYQWDFYNLFAYVLPTPLDYSSFQQQYQYQIPLQIPMSMPQHPSQQQPSNNISDMIMNSNPINFMPPMMSSQQMFGVPPPTLPRQQYHQKTVINTDINNKIDASKLPLNKRKRDSILKLVNETALSLSNLDFTNSPGDTIENRKKLQQIFNEKGFRKQMTHRGMWQMQLVNFPPYLQMDSVMNQYEISEKELNSVRITIKTDRLDRFPRLKWTVLKDFIKLKCIKLLNSTEAQIVPGSHRIPKRNHTSEEFSTVSDELQTDNTHSTTKEFYVGMYEDHDELVKVILEDTESNNSGEEIFYMYATFYKAIVGFHDKELYDLCLKSIQDQEYIMGYTLDVTELSPYEEVTDEIIKQDDINKKENTVYENKNESTDIESLKESSVFKD